VERRGEIGKGLSVQTDVGSCEAAFSDFEE